MTICKETPNPIVKKGSVIIFVHGFAANRHQFYDCAKKLNSKNDKYFDAGVVTLRSEENDRDKRIDPDARDKKLMFYPIDIIQDSLNNKFKSLKRPLIIKTKAFNLLTKHMKSSKYHNKIKKLTENGYNPIFRVEFSKLDMSNEREIEELGRFVDALKFNGSKVTMVGYSKGVLSILGYAAQKPKNVNKVVLIGATLAPIEIAKLAHKTLGNIILKEGIKDMAGLTDSHNKIRNAWNEKDAKKIEAHSIASSWSPYVFWGYSNVGAREPKKIEDRYGDGMVQCKDQLGIDNETGKGYLGLYKYIIEKNDLISAHHIFEPTDPIITELLEKILDDEIIKDRDGKNERIIVIGKEAMNVNNQSDTIPSKENSLDTMKKIRHFLFPFATSNFPIVDYEAVYTTRNNYDRISS